MYSGEASLLNVHLDSWKVVLYAYELRVFFRQTSECILRMSLEIHSVFGAYLHSVQEAIEQECEK